MSKSTKTKLFSKNKFGIENGFSEEKGQKVNHFISFQLNLALKLTICVNLKVIFNSEVAFCCSILSVLLALESKIAHQIRIFVKQTEF